MGNNVNVRETMTVHQALCELKTLDKRVMKAIQESKPVSCKEHASAKVDGMDVAEFQKQAKSQHDSAVGLIQRQRAIKAAVSQYNASKVITVCGREYTIAQAIWEMKYGIQEDKALLNVYTQMLRRFEDNIAKRNGVELNLSAEAAMNVIYGGKEKSNSEEYLKGLEDYKERHALELVDPLNVRKIIEELEKQIADFEANVDAAIQVANATTTIEIAY